MQYQGNGYGSTHGAEADSARPPEDLAGDDLRLLYEVGISAVVHGHVDAAKPVFDAIALLQPDNAAAAIGEALGHIVRGEPERAVVVLQRDGLGASKSSREAKGLLLLALQLANRRSEAVALHRELVDGPEGTAKELARKLYAGDDVTPAARGTVRPPINGAAAGR